MAARYYRCIVADPPWKTESGGGRIKRGADRHYKLCPTAEILSIMVSAPVWRPASTGCHLWLWSTSAAMKEAQWLLDALGFTYVLTAVWVKEGPFGLGKYMRHGEEYLLLGRMGKTMVPAEDSRPYAVVSAPRRGHSVKPDEAYDGIAMASPGPRLEMFARRQRLGWDCWGEQLP